MEANEIRNLLTPAVIGQPEVLNRLMREAVVQLSQDWPCWFSKEAADVVTFVPMDGRITKGSGGKNLILRLAGPERQPEQMIYMTPGVGKSLVGKVVIEATLFSTWDRGPKTLEGSWYQVGIIRISSNDTRVKFPEVEFQFYSNLPQPGEVAHMKGFGWQYRDGRGKRGDYTPPTLGRVIMPVGHVFSEVSPDFGSKSTVKYAEIACFTDEALNAWKSLRKEGYQVELHGSLNGTWIEIIEPYSDGRHFDVTHYRPKLRPTEIIGYFEYAWELQAFASTEVGLEKFRQRFERLDGRTLSGAIIMVGSETFANIIGEQE